MAIEIGGLYATLGLDTSDYDSKLPAAGKQIDALGTRLDSLSGAHSRLTSQGQAALHAIRSMGESLALGVSPTQALTQQLNHLSFAASGPGGIKGAFGEVAGIIKGFITPATAAVAGLAVLGVGMVLAAAKALEIEKSIRGASVALNGFGTASLASAEDGEKAVKRLRDIGIAADDARESVDKIRRTPGLSPSLDSTTKIVTAGADLGAITGAGTGAGTDQVIKLLQGGYESIIRYGVELRKISPIEAQQIRDLKDTAGATAATEKAFDLLSGRISGSYGKSLGESEKKIIELKNAWNAFLKDASTTAVITFLLDELKGIVKGIEDTIKEFKRLRDAALAVRDAVGRGINSVTTAGDKATETARQNSNEMADALAARDRADGGTGNVRGASRFDTSSIDVNTDALKRLSDVLAMASQTLPEGFSLKATSGKRNGGGGSFHDSGEAIDVQIVDKSGNALPNKGPIGSDPGLYKDLAIAARDANNSLYPGAPFTWGGRFETSKGSGMADWMHFDAGPERGRFGPPLAELGRDSTTTSASAADASAAIASGGGGVLAPLNNGDLVQKQIAEFNKINNALRQRGEEEIRATALIQGRQKAESMGLVDSDAEKFAQNEATQAVEQHRIGLQKATDDQELTNKRALETAKIYSVDYVAALRAAAAAQGELAVRQGTATDASSKASEILRTQAADAAASSSAAIPGMQREAEAAEKLAAALKISEKAGADSDIQARVAAATQDLMVKAMASGSKEAIQLAESIKDITEQLIRRNAAAELSKNFSIQNIDDKKQTEVLRLENSLVGQTTEQISRQVDLLKVKQQAEAAGLSITSDEVQERLKSVNALHDAADQLARNQSIMGGIKELGDTVFSSLSNVFDTVLNKTFKIRNAIGSVLKDLGKFLTDKAFKALFEGESAGGTGSGLSGIIGKLLGVGGGSSSPGSTGGDSSGVTDFGGGSDLPAFATGGSATVGGSGAIDSKIVSFKATPGELVNVQRGGSGSSGGAEVIRLELSHDNAFVSDIADQRIRTHSGTIIDVAVRRSQQVTRNNFGKMATETKARQG